MINDKEFLYLDYAATAPLSNVVMHNYYEATEIFGNPAAFYKEGEKAYQIIQQSKQNILKNLNHNEDWDILFTSGATESINTVFYSFQPDLVITTNLEHHATLAAINHTKAKHIALELFQVITTTPTYLSDSFKECKKILISIIAVNNETGLIIPVEKIKNIKKYVQSIYPEAEVLIHLDFTQGFCKIPYDMSEIDCYSFSAHKIGFFKGFGGLIYKKNTIDKYILQNPLIKGGKQQHGLRSGTENPMFIYLLDKLIETEMSNLLSNYQKAAILKSAFYQILPDIIKKYENVLDLVFTSKNTEDYSPYIVNFSILGIEGESLVSSLGNEIGISTGSACSEEDLSGSEVIKNYYKNLGVESEDTLNVYANSAVRLSYDAKLTLDQIVDIFKPKFDLAIKSLARASTHKKGE